jgi:hypothetical protein
MLLLVLAWPPCVVKTRDRDLGSFGILCFPSSHQAILSHIVYINYLKCTNSFFYLTLREYTDARFSQRSHIPSGDIIHGTRNKRVANGERSGRRSGSSLFASSVLNCVPVLKRLCTYVTRLEFVIHIYNLITRTKQHCRGGKNNW